ncbi:MAG: class I SAM-dependent methyltransferase [Myxococcota bacterium]
MTHSIDRWLQERVLRRLESWSQGELIVELPDGTERRFGHPNGLPAAVLQVRDPRFFRRLAVDPDVGVGEAYVDGWWTSPELPVLVAGFLLNQPHVSKGVEGLAGRPLRWLQRSRQWLRRNTRRGSQRNIHAHYDLGNDFFRLFLDESLAYSCAVFPEPSSTLEEGQRAKFEGICRKLRLGPRDHVLEIGCGWGGFAIHAARETGCRVTGITVSREQHALARQRVREAALEGQVDIRYCDYRDVDGDFDKIVSIEMLEAVGERYWDRFFKAVDRLLRRGGLALIQVIAVPDQHFPAYRRSAGWLQQYIFPGGMLPSLYEMQQSLRRVTRLELHSVDEIGAHYARTLNLWRDRFWKNIDRVRELGFDERFVRIWDYYLSLCAGTFSTHHNRDLQLVLTRPHNPDLFQIPGPSSQVAAASSR